ncbi:hypothetical protein [Dyella sp.]|jgi:hypothetical protein|uniref:hypothetical protein n=1 Tax=Dyella sp. TaxID=1869338 RepID=UPI002FD93CE7
MTKIRAQAVRETRRMLASLGNIWRSVCSDAALSSFYKERVRRESLNDSRRLQRLSRDNPI